jgi:hypothetical protein
VLLKSGRIETAAGNWVTTRVARCYIFIPKILDFVYFGRLWTAKL